MDKNLLRAMQSEFNRATQLEFSSFQRTEELFKAAGFREKNSFGIENILVIRLDAVGDFIMTSGFLRELRASYPSARITLVVSEYIYPLAELCPYVNEVLAFDMRKLSSGNTIELLRKTLDFAAKNLWTRHFTRSFCAQAGGRKWASYFMAYFSGARERIGYATPNDSTGWFFNRTLTVPLPIVHEAARAFNVLDAVGLKVCRTDLELWYGAEDVRTARQMLADIPPDRMKIAVGLGAGDRNRQYPVEQWAQAFRSLDARGCSFILFGGPSERDDAKRLQELLSSENVVNLVGRLSLRESAASIALTDMYIGNDTGTMHMAAAEQVPVIVVYRESRERGDQLLKTSPTTEYYMFSPWQTLSVALRPERARDGCRGATIYGGCLEPTAHCIAQITPDQIVDAFEKLRFILAHNPIGTDGQTILQSSKKFNSSK